MTAQPGTGTAIRRLLLLGGGHAHVHVLLALARQRWPGVAVRLVTPFERQAYSGMVPGLVAGHYTEPQCVIPLRPLADAAGAALHLGTAVALDAAARRVTLADGRIEPYDLLSIDTGAVQSRDLVPGAREHALFVRPIEHFLRALDALWALAASRVQDIVVIGGGAAGFELACAFAHRLGRPGIDRARVAWVTGGVPLAAYAPGVQRRARAALRELRVAVFEQAVAAVRADAVVLAGGARLACSCPVVATGAEPAPWLGASGLALDGRGFVAIGPTFQSPSHPNVLAAGDAATRTDAPHPRSGVYAVRAGPPLAANLQRLATGSGALRAWVPPRRTLNLLACGGRQAIAAWGPLSAAGGWVWRWKDGIDRGFVARCSTASVPFRTTATTAGRP